MAARAAMQTRLDEITATFEAERAEREAAYQAELDTAEAALAAEKAAAAPPAETPPKPGLCKVCSFQNDEKAKFCIKCGTKLAA